MPTSSSALGRDAELGECLCDLSQGHPLGPKLADDANDPLFGFVVSLSTLVQTFSELGLSGSPVGFPMFPKFHACA